MQGITVQTMEFFDTLIFIQPLFMADLLDVFLKLVLVESMCQTYVL